MYRLVAVLIAIVIFFEGCSIKSSPPSDEYTVVLQKLPQGTLAYGVCHDKSLKVLEPFGSNEYAASDLHYVVLPNEENHYNLSSWSQPLASTLYREMLRVFEKSKIFGSVANYTSIAKSDYILEMEINDFKQYFSSDMKHSYVVADITLTLIESKRFSIVAQKEFVQKIDTASLDAKGGVDALGSAFEKIASDAVIWLAGVCR